MQVCIDGMPGSAIDRNRVVAVLAGDLVLAGVDVVAEEDRLARTLERGRIRGGQHDTRWRRRLLGPGRPPDDRERDDGNRTRTQRYPSRLPH